MRQNRGSILTLFALGLALFGGWWIWMQWQKTKHIRSFTGQLEKTVIHALSESGVRDQDILEQRRMEHGFSVFKWVETSRRIRVRSGLRIQSVSQKIQASAEALGAAVQSRPAPDHGTAIEISDGILLLERLILVPVRSGSENPSGSAMPTKARIPRVAIVIDDVAADLDRMDRYSALGIPLTFAILPRDRNCKLLADKANRSGFGVILHLPMEPIDLAHNNPGGAGLFLKMNPAELRRQFDRDVASVPGITGINNHMGSAFTSNEAKMELVLGWVKTQNLFFLDSRTAPHSIVCHAALKVGVPCRENDTFLDNTDSAASIEHQLDQVLKLALRDKQTIAIGHYRRKFLAEALADRIPAFRNQGVEFVTLPTLYAPS